MERQGCGKGLWEREFHGQDHFVGKAMPLLAWCIFVLTGYSEFLYWISCSLFYYSKVFPHFFNPSLIILFLSYYSRFNYSWFLYLILLFPICSPGYLSQISLIPGVFIRRILRLPLFQRGAGQRLVMMLISACLVSLFRLNQTNAWRHLSTRANKTHSQSDHINYSDIICLHSIYCCGPGHRCGSRCGLGGGPGRHCSAPCGQGGGPCGQGSGLGYQGGGPGCQGGAPSRHCSRPCGQSGG